MKKSVILFIFMVLLVIRMQSQESENEGLFFYQIKLDEIKDYFDKYKYLTALDKNNVILTDEKIDLFFKDYIGKETMESLLLESFFRYTKNKEIQKKVLNYLQKNKLSDEYSQSLIRLYNSKEKKYQQDKVEQIQYDYNGKYFDENINLFYQSEKLFFNNELGIMLFDNPWAYLSFKNNDDKKSDDDSFVLIYGGGTNSMTINFNKFPNLDFEQFSAKEINKSYNKQKYDNWKLVELENKEIFENSGSDKIFIGVGIGPDTIPEIDCGTFDIYLYNEKLKCGYSISYFMNFSKINNNYKLRKRIWNQILFQLCFSYIEVSAH
jgi:hypothetical protein